MEIKFILPFIILLTTVIFISIKHKISFIRIFILSLLPIILLNIFLTLFPIISTLASEDLQSALKYLDIMWIIEYFFMTYALAFFPLILSSTMILYVKKIYTIQLLKLLLITPLIILFNMIFYIILWGYLASFLKDLTLADIAIPIVVSLITGTLSVAIFHYLTEYKKENND